MRPGDARQLHGGPQCKGTSVLAKDTCSVHRKEKKSKTPQQQEEVGKEIGFVRRKRINRPQSALEKGGSTFAAGLESRKGDAEKLLFSCAKRALPTADTDILSEK